MDPEDLVTVTIAGEGYLVAPATADLLWKIIEEDAYSRPVEEVPRKLAGHSPKG